MVGVGMAIIVPLMVMLGFVIHRGAIGTVVGALRRARLISRERAKEWKTKLADVDRHIRELHKQRSSGTRLGFVFILASRAVTYCATMTLIHAVGVDVSFALFIGVVSVGVLIQWVSSVVPLGLGLADSGNYALYSFLGAGGTHGLFVTMLNRARSFAVAILGLAVMAALSVVNRFQQRRMRARLRELRRHAVDEHVTG
jgi:uncharacterized membrane protein YbhN (UPF0104 family)